MKKRKKNKPYYMLKNLIDITSHDQGPDVMEAKFSHGQTYLLMVEIRTEVTFVRMRTERGLRDISGAMIVFYMFISMVIIKVYSLQKRIHQTVHLYFCRFINE